MKRLPSIITDKIELEIGECNCGYHFGVDATFIDQVGDVTFNCPSCNQPIDTAKLFPEDGGETSETTDPKRTVTVHHNGRDHTFPNFDHVEISQEIDIPGEDGPNELHVKATDEGIITDIWGSKKESLDTNLGTESETYEELADRLCEEND